MEHETHAQSTSINAAPTHPLQDIELNGNGSEKELNENMSAAAVDAAAAAAVAVAGVNNKQQSKNWVKFDDDNNDVVVVVEGSENATKTIETKITANNNNTTAAAAATQQQNKLSTLPLPPPPSVLSSNNARARSRSPNERTQQLRAETAPVQTQADIAPAVLTTESTHVNLNASGRQQIQTQQQSHPSQQQHQQQIQQQKQLTNQKTTTTNPNSSHKPHTNYNQNGTTTTTATTAAVGGNKSNSAMQKSVILDVKPSTSGTTTSITIPVETTTNTNVGAPPMRTIELSTGRIREGFANGDVIVTLLPANTKWPWITPAIFRPELVPEELMAQGLTLTVEDYVNAMETLVNDYRFTVYNICYKRILVCWILFAFTVLLTLLFSGLQGVALFSLGVGWLFLNAAAIFFCMWIKLRLSRGLEKCLARVNRQLMRHKILLVLDDRGRISCHKVNLCFMYFDPTQCVNYLNEFLEHTEQNGGEAIKAGWEAKLDIDMNDIVIQGSNPVRLSRKQERGMQLFLRYGSRWGMEALRGLVDITPLEPGRHCGQFQCPCQYIKEHLQCKPRVVVNNIGQVVWTRYPIFGG